MRKLVLLCCIMVNFCNSFSQDLVVTSEGDSLNCKITKLKNEIIYFTFKYKEEIRSTLLPVSQVKLYQYNFYQTAIVPSGKIVGHGLYPHWRFAINGGWGYQTAKVGDNVPSDFEQYVQELKSGYHIGGDVTYYFLESLGVGFKYQLFKTSNQIDNVYVINHNGTGRYGYLSDDISVTFIGPAFYTRYLNFNKKNALLFGLAIGYLGYEDKVVIVGEKYTLIGSTAGLIWDLGYDIGINPNFAIGFNLSLLSGWLSEYNLNDGLTTTTIKLGKNFIDLDRVDLSIGIRFNTSR